MDEITTAGTLETPIDAGKGPRGEVARWMREIDSADQEEKTWREKARETVDRYRDEEKGTANTRKGKSRFNILWSNTEVLRPSLYSATPRPDVRRRYRDPDPTAKATAEVIERACAYSLDAYDFDHIMDLAVLDYLLPGRAVTRLHYTPTKDEAGEVVWESAECEHVPWARFRRGPGATWSDVPWISFEHLLTREELDEKFPGNKVELDVELAGAEDKRAEDSDVFKRGRIYEIWEKGTRKVHWIAPSVEAGPVRSEDDPLKLRRFWPVPRPLYSLTTSGSLVPVEEYRLYRDQAMELDEITDRIRRLVSTLKARGLYDATMDEMTQVMQASDNEYIPSTGAQNILAGRGSLADHIWTVPIEEAARALAGLYKQRDQIKQVIYEITGLSDILRGSSDPNETLGAQQIKAQTGSLRVQKRQREVQRYARDLIEMKAELMVEHFSPQTLQIMTGEQIDPKALELLKNGSMRDYRIDIETDSTISADQKGDEENMTKLIGSMAEYGSMMPAAIEGGLITLDAAKAIMVHAVRKFKMGREVEDLLEDMGQQQNPAQAQQEEQQKQAEMQEMQQQMMQQAKEQAEAGVAQEREALQVEQAKIQMQVQSAQKDGAMSKEQLGLKAQQEQLKIEKGMLELSRKQAELQRLEADINRSMEQQAADRDAAEAEATRVDEMEAEMKEMAEAIAQLAQILAQGQMAAQEQNRVLLESLTAPREIVRDKAGKVTGARVRLDS